MMTERDDAPDDAPELRSTCTWMDCTARATSPQLGKDGVEWANPCYQHAKELEHAIESQAPKYVLRAWARAGHGHSARKRLEQAVSAGTDVLLKAFRPKNWSSPTEL